MPRAVSSDSFGPPEAYALVEAPSKPLETGQVRIAIKAAGISFVDVLTARGEYQVKPPLPFIPGSEGAGIVAEVGGDVTGFAVGDRVVFSAWGGLFADEVVLPQRALRLVPDGMELISAAVFPVSYATAWHALVDRGQLKAGETLLVLGAAGATGLAAVQIGKHLGALVIALASNAEKRALTLASGADSAIDGRAEDWRDKVKATNGNKPVDVVFDLVGGTMTEPAFRSLAWGGRHLIIGFPAGIAALRTNLPLLKGASLIGVDIRQFGIFEPERSEANRDTIFALAARGILKPAIAHIFPLEDFAEAMNAAAAGQSAGRIVLVMD
ncbi:MAG: NADPH:quinone oxidoreductase family protein [Sphingomonadaceae bacterium]|nr:NADPH:quinone oxidoreductase family protein [Sphingomonadaceae bacterium]